MIRREKRIQVSQAEIFAIPRDSRQEMFELRVEDIGFGRRLGFVIRAYGHGAALIIFTFKSIQTLERCQTDIGIQDANDGVVRGQEQSRVSCTRNTVSGKS